MNNVEGVDELLQVLDTLGAPKATKRVARVGLNAGLTVIASAQRRSTPVGKNKRLKRAIGKRLKKNRQNGIHEAKAGINVAKKGNKRAPHGPIVALGTRMRKTRTGANRGRVRVNNWIQRATLAARPRTLQTMRLKTLSAIEKEAAKL